MVAYSFNPRFETAIREGWKTQTIRETGWRRHARPGDMLQLYCGMRTKHCRKITSDVRCTAVMQVWIEFVGGAVVRIETDGVPVIDLEAFAIRDGFTDLADMSAFWRQAHPEAIEIGFDGLLIEWHMPRRAELGEAA